MGKITQAEISDYEKCLDSLNKFVPEAAKLPLPEMAQHWYALTEFYMRPEQASISRQGICCVLLLTHTDEQYRRLLAMHTELIQVWIDFKMEGDMDYLGFGPYSFFSVIMQNSFLTWNLLDAAYQIFIEFGAHTHAVLQAVLTIGRCVAANFETGAGERPFIQFVIRRIDRFMHGYTSIKRLLMRSGIQNAGDWLVPTDGDMHCGGRVPYLVTCNGQRWVYKPHNMRAEKVILAALQFFSDLLAEIPDKLRILDIWLLEDGTGLMEFAEHTYTMDETQASLYFFKLGILLYFAKLFGIGDLHYENIMATADGPALIDLECVLDYSTIQNHTWDDNSLELLKKAFNGTSMLSNEQLKPAIFCVDTKIPLFRNYKEQILDGFTAASNFGAKNRESEEYETRKERLLQYYRELLYHNLLIEPLLHRIVPYRTSDFYDKMYLYIDNYNKGAIIRDDLGELIKQIVLALFRICCKGSGMDQNTFQTDYLDMKTLSACIYTDLFFGEIPIFHLKYERGADNNVYQTGYIDLTSFFLKPMCIGPVDLLVEKFENQMDWLASEDAIQKLENFVENQP